MRGVAAWWPLWPVQVTHGICRAHQRQLLSAWRASQAGAVPQPGPAYWRFRSPGDRHPALRALAALGAFAVLAALALMLASGP